MPESYQAGAFVFVKVSECNGICYYNIIHSSGRHWDYNHPFTSIQEMNDYADSYKWWKAI